MDVSFNKIDNFCFDDRNGSIAIESIVFTDPLEIEQYQNYTIIWSGDLDQDSIISTDGFVISFLKNGTYNFKIVSTTSSAESSLYTASIESPQNLTIKTLKYSNYSCSNTGYLYLEIDGGIAPYNVSFEQQSVIIQNNIAEFSNVSPGEFSLFITDSNGCSYEYPEIISIKNAAIEYSINSVIPPQLLDDYAILDMNVVGYGPFNFKFYNKITNQYVYVDTFETKYLVSYDKDTLTYNYRFENLISAGEYSLTISNNEKCENFIDTLNIPNINPMTLSFNIKEDDSSYVPTSTNIIPIYNTFFIPYKLIKDNTELWKYLKNKSVKDELKFLINNELYHFKITKNFLNKDCDNDENIELLRLGNDEEDWFYYFYIAPGINLQTNPELIGAKLEIQINKHTNISVIMGLNEDGNIDPYNPSLCIGNFVLDGIGYNEFYNGCLTRIHFEEPLSANDYTYYVKNTKKIVSINSYQPGYVTVLNFLEQFDVLNKNIKDLIGACSISQEDYQYIVQIETMLKKINNFNNVDNIYVFNPADNTSNGSLFINIDANDFITNIENVLEENEYSIKYFYFNQKSQNISSVYIGSKSANDERTLENIPNGFYIVKIKDKYNNIPKFININNNTISYDEHFATAKKIIQNYNNLVLDKFVYNDVLINVGEKLIVNDKIPAPIETPQILPEFSIVRRFNIVQQTKDNTNTATINIELNDSNIINCYIYGPKNYKKSFKQSVSFTNLVPGVYTILGDAKELEQYSLYQNEIRIFLEKNTIQDVFLEFASYETSISFRTN